MKKLINIKKNIKLNTKSYLIAEIAQAHDGSLGYAHSFIDLAKSVGADAVKFQCHIANEETTNQDKFRKKFSYKDESRFEYWKRMEFTLDEWIGLKKHADKNGLDFICSVFSKQAILMMQKINLKIWKIASGEIFDKEIITDIARQKGFIILSTGMINSSKIPEFIKIIEKINKNIAVLYCRSIYPTPLDKVYLNNFNFLKNKIKQFPVGLSDHSGNQYVPIAGISLGAKILEMHLCFDKLQFGPDTSSSLDPKQFIQVFNANKVIHQLLTSNNNLDKDKNILKISKLFKKSLSLNKDLPKGHILQNQDLVLKKPSTGISPKLKKNIVGKKLKNNVSKNNLLKISDLE